MLHRNKRSVILPPLLMLLAGSLLAQDYTPMSREGYSQTAQTVTNGQAVTLKAGDNVLTSSGQADTYTNTITLANVAAANVAYWLVNADGSTNTIALAKTGNWKTAAVVLSAGETLYLVSTATNALRAVK